MYLIAEMDRHNPCFAFVCELPQLRGTDEFSWCNLDIAHLVNTLTFKSATQMILRLTFLRKRAELILLGWVLRLSEVSVAFVDVFENQNFIVLTKNDQKSFVNLQNLQNFAPKRVQRVDKLQSVFPTPV